MSVRKPVVAGQFYPADRDTCLAQILDCMESVRHREDLPAAIVAGIVPHAGWAFSGPLAAAVFSSVHQRHEDVAAFVICGAAHRYMGARAAVDDSDAWETPLGQVHVDSELRDSLSNYREVIVDGVAHRQEHSIEVQVPFIKYLFPKARILPVVVPPTESAIEFGEALAEIIVAGDKRVVVLGSTDLTHYGPNYGFTPMGPGAEGLLWASEVNDREFVDLALDVEPERLLTDAVKKGNACGPGAAAAAVTVARELGVRAGLLLEQTTSNEIMCRRGARPGSDSVGYAAIVL